MPALRRRYAVWLRLSRARPPAHAASESLLRARPIGASVAMRPPTREPRHGSPPRGAVRQDAEAFTFHRVRLSARECRRGGGTASSHLELPSSWGLAPSYLARFRNVHIGGCSESRIGELAPKHRSTIGFTPFNSVAQGSSIPECPIYRQFLAQLGGRESSVLLTRL